MVQRANWKGHLKLSLVSCAVALFPTSSTKERVSFHLLNRETGHRLKQQYVDAETGDLVPTDERARGYEVEKDTYVVVEDAELDAVEIESTHTIDIETFVPRSEIDPVYCDQRYFIAPDDKVGQEAFGVIRAAMAARDMLGIAHVVLNGRERIIMLEPRDKGLIGTLLHYAYEVRDDAPVFDDIPETKPSKEMLDLAGHIIETKTGHFDPSSFEDRYQDALVALIEAKRAGRTVAAPKAAPSGNVVNLMDALRRSLASDKTSSSAKAADKGAAKPAPAKAAGKAAPAKAAAGPKPKKPARKAS